MLRPSSIATGLCAGGGVQDLIDHLRGGRFRDLGQRADFENLLEAILGGFTLIPLAVHQAEQVPALAIAHRLGTVARGCGPGRAIAARARRGRYRTSMKRRARRLGTHSGARDSVQVDAVQLLEGDDTDIDSVTDGAG